jgi:hypothetical protein
MAEPHWVILGEAERSLVRGISIDGAIVIAVTWRPAWLALDASGESVPAPAGYYYETGNIVQTELLEAAEAPTAEGWARMRTAAFAALKAWGVEAPDRIVPDTFGLQPAEMFVRCARCGTQAPSGPEELGWHLDGEYLCPDCWAARQANGGE